MHRRVFLKSGAMALVTIGLSPSFLRRSVFARVVSLAPRGKILVVVFQRGAADALNVVVPHGEAEYYTLRPQLAIPRPTQVTAGPAGVTGGGGPGAIDLDGFFGLHPALAPLVPFWERGMLAPIHAVGSPSATRSHFDAQDFMETGTPDDKNTADGWLNRYLATHGTCAQCQVAGKPSPFRAVALDPTTPRILEGPAPTIAMASLGDFSVRAVGNDVQRLEALYATGSADLIHGTGAETFEAVHLLQRANPQQYQPANGADYPRSPFGQNLRQIAQLIRCDVGLEIAFTDVGGWDTHVQQGSVTGQLAARLDDFARGLAAFATDLGDRMADVLVLTVSEFGRTARQNGTGGTDHGHAGAMFLLGGTVKGRKVYGRWPGLAPEQLFEGRDLALTTDFRDVFAEILAGHLGARDARRIFPKFTPARKPLGLV